jgi:hypothetical protein
MAHVSHWTFPEIALAISMCSQHMSNPGEEHWDYLLWILDYVYTNRDSERLFTRCNGGLRTPTSATATQTTLVVLTPVARERGTDSSSSATSSPTSPSFSIV